jgi:hypothetical protein
MNLSRFVLASVLASSSLLAQALPEALFSLKQMDMHLHCGMERPIEMNAWLDLAVNDGRQAVVLLDHLELYRKTPAAYEAWRHKNKSSTVYPVGAEGHDALMASFEQAARRRDLIVFKGWEIYEGELDTGLEAAPMRLAEVIGWHISSNNEGGVDGQTLIRRAKQIRDIQKQFPVPMIVFHPFPARAGNLHKVAKSQGRDPQSLTAAEYRFFRPGEQQELIGVLKGASVYIEIGRGAQGCMKIPACWEALIADIKPLAEGGLQFTVSTDNHGVAGAKTPFEPERYCEPLGITPLNTNGIVREMLVLRARRSFGLPAR